MKREKYELLTADNAMLLLVDHQDGTMSWTNTLPLRDLKRNTLLLAKAANQGTLMHELRDIAPDIYDNRIKREGIVDAFMDPAFEKEVKNTKRRRIIIARITTEVCVTFPTIRALREGYDVFVVQDASGR